jgi:trimethylamine:corrinoid methyltransferase-like protein
MGNNAQSSSKRRSRRDRLAAKDNEAARPESPAPAEFDVAMPRPLPAGVPAARPTFAYLDDARVGEFVERSYRLLQEHGIHVSHPAAAAKLGEAGCKVESRAPTTHSICAPAPARTGSSNRTANGASWCWTT